MAANFGFSRPEASTSLELLAQIGTFTPAFQGQICSWTKNVLQIWSLSCMCSHKKKSQKNPIILLSSHATAQEEEAEGRNGGNSQTKRKNITSYIKFMGGIDSSDMILYTYLDER
jgi:hypothetical protein